VARELACKRWKGERVTPAYYTHEGVKLCDPITWDEWVQWWKGVAWKKTGGHNGLRHAHMKAMTMAGHWMSELLWRLSAVAVRHRLNPPQWGVELLWQIEKTPGVTDIKKQRPIKLLDVIRKCVQGVLQHRVNRGVERMGLMTDMQAAFREGMSTSISLLHVNMMSEWCAMHGEGLADQGLDVAAAYDSVNAEMKELCMLRMGLGREFAEMQNEFDMGDKLLVLTGYGVSDEVCREWEAMDEEEKPWQRSAPTGVMEEG
jgi:hypothetical protein